MVPSITNLPGSMESSHQSSTHPPLPPSGIVLSGLLTSGSCSAGHCLVFGPRLSPPSSGRFQFSRTSVWGSSCFPGQFAQVAVYLLVPPPATLCYSQCLDTCSLPHTGFLLLVPWQVALTVMPPLFPSKQISFRIWASQG